LAEVAFNPSKAAVPSLGQRKDMGFLKLPMSFRCPSEGTDALHGLKATSANSSASWAEPEGEFEHVLL
jgi:hypothetical protein